MLEQTGKKTEQQPADKSQDSILPNQRYLRAGGLNHLSQEDNLEKKLEPDYSTIKVKLTRK